MLVGRSHPGHLFLLFAARKRNKYQMNSTHIRQLIDLVEMSSQQVVSEDAKANAEINQVAKYVADFFISSKYNYGIPYSIIVKTHDQDSPTITDPALVELLKNITFLYRAPKTSQEQNVYGTYHPRPLGSETIWLNSQELTDRQELASTLTHELRHALDDLKSGYTAGWQDKQVDQMGDPSAPGQYQRYLQLSHEVNARFSQALMDMANDPDITRSNLRDKIIQYFRKNKITLQTLNTDNDPKLQKANDRYQRLYAKAASFWQAYEKIKTQPQTAFGIPPIPKSATTVISTKPNTAKQSMSDYIKNFASTVVKQLFGNRT
jgi:hypothetical protein